MFLLGHELPVNSRRLDPLSVCEACFGNLGGKAHEGAPECAAVRVLAFLVKGED